MKWSIFIFLFFLFSCDGVHLNITVPVTFKEGKVVSSRLSEEKLELVVKSEKDKAIITIQPFRIPPYIKYSINGLYIRVVSKISPAGIERILSFYDREKLLIVIGNKVGENITIIEDYKISRGNLIKNTNNNERLWTNLKLYNGRKEIILEAGEAHTIYTSEGEFLFLFLGASVVNPATEKQWVAREAKNFMADFILLRLN